MKCCFYFHPRSQDQDSSLPFTPPWEQSLGLVTSSAETEEGCRSQGGGPENNGQTDNSTAPQLPQRGCSLESHKVTEEKAYVLSHEHSFYNSPSFDQDPESSNEKSIEESLHVDPWFSLSQPGCRSYSHNAKEFSNGQHTRTFLSASVAWEDLPFSESLAEFLHEEEKDFNIGGENKVSQKQMPGTLMKDTNIVVEPTSACQTNMQTTPSHSTILLDVTNTPAPDGRWRDLSNQVCKERSATKNVYPHEISQGNDKARQSFESEEEQFGGDAYDCSADLFTFTNNNTETLSTPSAALRTEAEVLSSFSKTDWQHLRNEHADATYLTPLKQNRKRKMNNSRSSLVPQEPPDLDFVPPSQSTPIVKEGVVKQSLTSSERNLMGESAKENSTWSMIPNICCRRLTPESSLWKSETLINPSQVEKHLRLQRRTLNLASTRKQHCKNDPRLSDASVGDHEKLLPDEGIIAPTPLRVGGKWQTDDSSSDLGSTWKRCEEDGVDCKRPLLDQTVTLSHRGLAQTGSADSAVVTDRSLCHDLHLDDENQTCDWSRDLFSDSV